MRSWDPVFVRTSRCFDVQISYPAPFTAVSLASAGPTSVKGALNFARVGRVGVGLSSRGNSAGKSIGWAKPGGRIHRLLTPNEPAVPPPVPIIRETTSRGRLV